MDKEYNGWSNRATWEMNMMLDSDDALDTAQTSFLELFPDECLDYSELIDILSTTYAEKLHYFHQLTLASMAGSPKLSAQALKFAEIERDANYEEYAISQLDSAGILRLSLLDSDGNEVGNWYGFENFDKGLNLKDMENEMLKHLSDFVEEHVLDQIFDFGSEELRLPSGEVLFTWEVQHPHEEMLDQYYRNKEMAEKNFCSPNCS